ncbi:hypothetical protein ACJIZ3_022289 [Penstemon smallii]|uniref:Remorin n=1 Tax=Penstemon smallii TaxID=265156 RepID=A0ABD3TMN6_9LAMI
MAEEEAKKLVQVPDQVEGQTEAPKEVAAAAEDKIAIPPPAVHVEKPEDCKALAIIQKPEPVEEKKLEGSLNRDAVLARVATEKRLCLIKAWEDSEKSKAENKAQKKVCAIGAWENSKKASLEAELKKIEEQLEIKKAELIEKLKNKVVHVHKEAEEKRAIIEAKRGEDLLKAEEFAAKYRATGTGPKKLLGCF